MTTAALEDGLARLVRGLSDEILDLAASGEYGEEIRTRVADELARRSWRVKWDGVKYAATSDGTPVKVLYVTSHGVTCQRPDVEHFAPMTLHPDAVVPIS